MKNYLFLRFLDLFKKLFPKDIDYIALRNIIGLKILLDSRTSSNISFQSLNGRKQNSSIGSKILKLFRKNGTTKDVNRNLTTLILYLFIGSMSSFLFALPLPAQDILGVVITFFMIFIGTRIISVFSTVLIDTKDSSILLPKPVNKKTLSMARFLYAIYYIGIMSFAFIIVPAIIAGIAFAPSFGIVLLVEIIFVDLFLVAIVALLYYYVLKFFDGEKLKDVVNGIQIILAIIIFVLSHAMYIIQPIAMRLKDMSFHIWFFFTPTFWFTSPYVLLQGNINIISIIGSVCAIFIPLIFIGVYLSVLENFEIYLQKLDQVSKSKKRAKFSLMNSIGKMLCTGKQELAFFDFSIEMLKSEREFKTKLYPQIVSSILSPVVIILAFSQNLTYKELKIEPWYLAFYLGTAGIASLVYMIKYSNAYKGAWIYQVVPLRDESIAFTGALKAFFVRVILPTLIIIAIAMVIVWGNSVIPQAITIIFATALAVAVSYKYTTTSLPFSVSFRDRPRGNKGKGYTVTIILALAAGLQFVFDRYLPYGNFILMFIMIIACIFTWKFIFSAPRKKLIQI
ncbi:hypothetical protein [uncultured Clostridium sp.]|jgi:hypothetical protein|uniref:hypothetical protein n=1 Tax=uncultured Clostridium sp. TaxID=59620 RepID=UPI00262F84EC|nr:hypothetical protein [uncultured Clostridium sp.]